MVEDRRYLRVRRALRPDALQDVAVGLSRGDESGAGRDESHQQNPRAAGGGSVHHAETISQKRYNQDS
jgi:hypothetical protein